MSQISAFVCSCLFRSVSSRRLNAYILTKSKCYAVKIMYAL